MILTILQALAITGSLAFLIYHFRSPRVLEERERILNEVRALISKDKLEGRDWHWRVDKFKEVDSLDMLLAFWKPVKSFYLNNDALFNKLPDEEEL